MRMRISRSAPARGFLSLLLSTSFGSLLALILSPVITRLFDPSGFGSFTLLTAIALVLAPLMSMRLEFAVPLPRKESESYALAHAGLACALALGASLSVVFFFVGPLLGEVVGQETAGEWLWTTPIMASAMAVFSALNALAIRGARYRAIAWRNVLMVTTTLGLQIGAGVLGFDVGGLVLGFALGQVVGAASLLLRSGLTSPDAVNGRQISLILAVLRRHRTVPTLLAPAGFLSALGLQAPVLLIAHFYSSDVVGWFGLTQRVLAAPIALIGLSVAQVYLSEIARSRREGTGRERHQFWTATKALGFCGLFLAAGLIALGPPVFALLFGEDWRASGEFARILSVALAAQLLSSPLSQTLIVFERTTAQILWDASRLVVVSTAVSVAAIHGPSVNITVAALSASLTLMYLVQWNLSRATVTRTPEERRPHRRRPHGAHQATGPAAPD